MPKQGVPSADRGREGSPNPRRTRRPQRARMHTIDLPHTPRRTDHPNHELRREAARNRGTGRPEDQQEVRQYFTRTPRARGLSHTPCCEKTILRAFFFLLLTDALAMCLMSHISLFFNCSSEQKRLAKAAAKAEANAAKPQKVRRVVGVRVFCVDFSTP